MLAGSDCVVCVGQTLHHRHTDNRRSVHVVVLMTFRLFHPFRYHIELVNLLAELTEGKNVYTEIKCHSLITLDDIVSVVTHPECIIEVL